MLYANGGSAAFSHDAEKHSFMKKKQQQKVKL